MRYRATVSSKDKRGVTLTELVVVMAVISVLTAVAMPMYKVGVKRSKEMELKSSLRTMRSAIDEYKRYVDEGRIAKETDSGYPPELETLVNPVAITNKSPMPVKSTENEQAGTVQLQKGTLPDKMRFLRKIPVDPMTGDTEWGLRSNQDDPDSSMWGGQDVFDVYSKSDRTALDGSSYEDW